MGNNLDLIGMRFGKLVVTSFSHSKNNKRYWNCICDCGNTTKVKTSDLRSGNTQSCGCKRAETIKAVCSVHGLTHKKPYNIWATIKQRCCNENCCDYPNYGGRGIVMHTEWLCSFKSFFDYVSALPHYGEPGYSLDRIDNDGNYEPGNVRWATIKEQNNNRRKRRWKKKPT